MLYKHSSRKYTLSELRSNRQYMLVDNSSFVHKLSRDSTDLTFELEFAIEGWSRSLMLKWDELMLEKLWSDSNSKK